MQNVLFICRGSVEVGLGHLMRCRTVAEEMAGRADVEIGVIGDAAIAATVLGRIPHSVVADDAGILELCRTANPEIVVFDLLDIDENVFRVIRADCTTVCICPVFNLLQGVDLAFSRAASPVHVRLAQRGGPPVIRTGYRYATIGRHCQPIPSSAYTQNVERSPLSVAISMGGADAPNKTLQILESIKNIPADMLFWVLLGEGYVHSYQRLVDCLKADGRHEIILARTAASMWRILDGCCVAILAGGITTYEAAYAGIPSIITLEDGRQQYLIQELVQAGAAMYAGAPLAASLPAMNDALSYLDANRDVLLNMHHRGKSLLDNQGARRIASEILSFHESGRNQESLLCASA